MSDLTELDPFGSAVTGISNTVFISQRGYAAHPARLVVAIDPPTTLSPLHTTAQVSIDSGMVMSGDIVPELLRQVRAFIELNRNTLIDYWECRCDTAELLDRLRSI